MHKSVRMSRWLIVTVILLMLGAAVPAPILASERHFPEPGQFYRVTDVAESDRLNVRDFAGSDADVVGSFSPYASGIVVTGLWQEIGGSMWWELVYPGAESRAGWVNARFLMAELSGAERWARAQSGYALNCGGTEPFWSLVIDGDQARYALLGEDERTFAASPWIDARGLSSGSQFAIGLRDRSDDGLIVVVRAHEAYCSDNMSDISYPFYGTMVLPGGDVLGGCCSRASR